MKLAPRTIAVALPFLVCLAAPARGLAQSFTTEADVTVGRSSETVTGAASQLRLFGASKSDWRYFIEAAWGQVAGPESDVFGAAYPYDKRIRPMDAFVEKTTMPGGKWLLGIRAGRYRTPFGISGRSDHAYAGFSRAPLIRYGENWTISNTFFETGASVIVGKPSLFLETSLGRSQDEGEAIRRRSGVNVTGRLQGYFRSLIVGVSYLRTQPTEPAAFARGHMVFGGIDARWSHRGAELRGEWINGRPFDTVTTRGGYIDAMFHRPAMGPVSAVARVERLDYDAGPYSAYLRRGTIGARVRVIQPITAQFDLVRQPGGLADGRSTAFDACLTYSRRF
jgi:hypothetical protein